MSLIFSHSLAYRKGWAPKQLLNRPISRPNEFPSAVEVFFSSAPAQRKPLTRISDVLRGAILLACESKWCFDQQILVMALTVSRWMAKVDGCWIADCDPGSGPCAHFSPFVPECLIHQQFCPWFLSIRFLINHFCPLCLMDKNLVTVKLGSTIDFADMMHKNFWTLLNNVAHTRDWKK